MGRIPVLNGHGESRWSYQYHGISVSRVVYLPCMHQTAKSQQPRQVDCARIASHFKTITGFHTSKAALVMVLQKLHHTNTLVHQGSLRSCDRKIIRLTPSN